VTTETRFPVPEGFTRIIVPNNSFASYLRTFPLKPHGSVVKYYNGNEKRNRVYDAVFDIDVGAKDLQQCADAIIRLRAEYLYKEKKYNDITFNFTNGFAVAYSRWITGERIKVEGNKSWWVKTSQPANNYEVFKKYLETVFIYAGTLSLSKSLKSVDFMNMQIGDVLIQGGSPGHAVIVIDMAENTKGEKLYMLAQSYMPAQDIHVLKNNTNPGLSPWYTLKQSNNINTPEWTFKITDLKRF